MESFLFWIPPALVAGLIWYVIHAIAESNRCYNVGLGLGE